MTSYVNRRTLLFQDAGDGRIPIEKKHSDGRLKTMFSATDTRAWCDVRESRRQHILELIRRDHGEGICLGKFVPIDVVIDTLLSNKNADIERLKQQLEELQNLLDLYDSLLTPEQRAKLDALRLGLEIVEEEIETLTGLEEITDTGATDVTWTSDTAASDTEAVDTGPTETDTDVGAALDAKKSKCQERKEAREMAKKSKCSSKKSKMSCKSKTPTVDTEKTGISSDETYEEQIGTTFLEDMDDENLKDAIIKKDAEIISLKNALAACQAENEEQKNIASAALEQLEGVKGFKDVTSVESQTVTQAFVPQTQAAVSTRTGTSSDPCGLDEIAALEQEIEDLRSKGELTPEQEAEVIRKEVEVLKKYCNKLANIQKENDELKKALAEGGGGGGGVISSDIEERCAELEKVKEERDNLLKKVAELEQQLEALGKVAGEVEVFRERSKMLDDVLSDRDAINEKLEELEYLREQVKELKKKADMAEELEAELNRLRQAEHESQAEVASLLKENQASKEEIENMKSECETLRTRTADMYSVELDAEDIRMERDRLKQRVEELSNIECEYLELLEKTKCFEVIKSEREMYRNKYEQLIGLECECDMLRTQVEKGKQTVAERDALQQQVKECECCIAEQEDEIKRLINHVDRLSQGREEQQERVKGALGSMRAELEQKNNLIAASEEQLAAVQDQLKNTIAGVSCETACLRQRIEELEAEVAGYQAILSGKDNEISFLHGHIEEKEELISNLSEERRASMELANAARGKDEIITAMKRELEAAKGENEKLQSIASKMSALSGDEHLQKMLQQSKCAVKRVCEEIGRTYKEHGRAGSLTESDIEKIMNQDPNLAETSSVRTQTKSPKSVCAATVTPKTETTCAAMETAGGDNIDELKAKVSQLEKDLAECRRQSADNERMLAENSALRRHSTEVQEVAKDQIQELVDHLQKAQDRIAVLEEDNEKLRAALEEAGIEAPEPPPKEESVEEIALPDDAGDAGEPGEAVEEPAFEMIDSPATVESAPKDAISISSECQEIQNQLEQALREKENLQNLLTELQSSDSGDMIEKYAQLKQDYDNLLATGAASSSDDREELLQQIEDQKAEINNLLESLKGSDLGAKLAQEIEEKKALQDLVESLENQLKQLGEGTGAVSASGGLDSGTAQMIDDLKARLEEEQTRAQVAEDALAAFKNSMSGDELESAKLMEGYIQEIAALKQQIKECEESATAIGDIDDTSAVSAAAEQLGGLRDQLKLTPEQQEIFDQIIAGYDDQIKALSDELRTTKKHCNDTIATLKAQYDRDIKNVHTKHNDGISKLQSSHEELLQDIASEHEKEVDGLRRELQQSKEAIDALQKEKLIKGKGGRSKVTETKKKKLSTKTCTCVSIKPTSGSAASSPPPSPPSKSKSSQGVCSCGSNYLETIMNKILKSGFECLTFEELQYIHTKTCDATASMLDKPCRPPCPPRPCTPCPPPPPCKDAGLSDDKMAIMRKKVAALQIAVRLERQRLEELKQSLQQEKSRNGDLVNKIGCQNKTVANLQVERDLMARKSSYHEDKLQQYIVTVEQERGKVRSLEDDLQKERNSNRHLQCLLECERERAKQNKRKDSEALESMRIQLERTLNSEMMLKMQLEQKPKPGKPGTPRQLEQQSCPPCAPQSSGQAPKSHTTSFYTELSVQDVKKKQNFVHHCCLRNVDKKCTCSNPSSAGED